MRLLLLWSERVFAVLSSRYVFSRRRRQTRCSRDWSSDVCSSDLAADDKHLSVFEQKRAFYHSRINNRYCRQRTRPDFLVRLNIEKDEFILCQCCSDSKRYADIFELRTCQRSALACLRHLLIWYFLNGFDRSLFTAYNHYPRTGNNFNVV